MAVHWEGTAASAAAAAVERHVRGLDSTGNTFGHHAIRVAISVLLPWLVFMAVGLLLLLELEEARTLVVGQLTGVAGICLLLVTVGMASGRSALIALGLWSLASGVFGVCMGTYLNHEYGRIYWRIHSAGDGLANVDPSASPDPSAALFHFSSAFVDDRRTIGFVAGGRIYCVAPVARKGKPSDVVAFWAAGVGCCERRSNFACGSTTGPALSYPTAGDKYFAQAIAQAASVYGLKSEGAQHVFFEGDPSAFLEGVWREGVVAAVLTAALHLLTCVVVSSAMRRVGGGLMLKGGGKKLSSLLGTMDEERLFELDLWWRCRSAEEAEQEMLELELWRSQTQRLAQGQEPMLLGDVVIAQDCGFNELQALARSVGMQRYLTAALTLGLLLFNCSYIVKTDITLLATRTEGTTHMYLASEAILKPIIERGAHVLGFDTNVQLNAHVAVALSELVCFCYILGWMFAVGVRAAMSETWSRRRWKDIHRIFFSFLEPLSGFSAMALLHFVNPTILMQHIVDFSQTGRSEPIRTSLRFFITRLMFFIVGFDAFLVKFRQTSESINQDALTVRSFLQAAGFMLQLLGIVQVSSIVRRRLALAFFGGEEASAGPDEKARESVFYALITRELHKHSHSTLDFVVMMLSFSDSDFQHLMLNKSQSKASSNGKGSSTGRASNARASFAAKGKGKARPDSSMEEFHQVAWAITSKEKL